MQEIVGELVGDFRRVVVAARRIPFWDPIQRPQYGEYRDLAVEPVSEAAVCDALIDEFHKDLLVAPPLVERTRQIRLGEKTPLMEDDEGTTGILGSNLDVRHYGRSQSLDDRAALWQLRLDDQEAFDAEFDNLIEQRFFAVDVRIETAGQHADFLGDVAHGGPGVAEPPKKGDGRFEDRGTGFF